MNLKPETAPLKPGSLTAVGALTLASGILNIIWALGLTCSIILGTLGIGVICAPITILPAILGVFEIIYASQLLSTPSQVKQPSQIIAVLQIACIIVGNILSVVVGILALIFYSQPDVQEYFASFENPQM